MMTPYRTNARPPGLRKAVTFRERAVVALRRLRRRLRRLPLGPLTIAEWVRLFRMVAEHREQAEQLAEAERTLRELEQRKAETDAMLYALEPRWVRQTLANKTMNGSPPPEPDEAE